MKVVINNFYGWFEFSDKAEKFIANLKGNPVGYYELDRAYEALVKCIEN